MNNIVIPKKGFGDINFSMNEVEVQEYLGEPSSIDIDNGEKIIYFKDLEVTIIFELIDKKFVMSSIELESEQYKLWETSIINSNYEQIVDLLHKNRITTYREEEESFSKYIFCDNSSISFEFENNIASVLCLDNPSI